MISLRSSLTQWNIQHQYIIVRADLNIPLDDNSSLYDHRLVALLPTVDTLLHKHNIIILITHIGRPKEPSKGLSTQRLIPWFLHHGYTIVYASTIADAYTKSRTNAYQIVLLENIRFFPEEQQQDPRFAQELAALGDYYVNDAFGSVHRSDTSLTLLPQQFDAFHKTVGFLIERELRELNKLIDAPQKPFTLIIGGGKIQDKIPVIERLLDTIDTLMLCPAAVFTFLDALYKPIGKSLVDKAMRTTCKTIIQKAEEKNIRILLPLDYIIAEHTFDGPLSLVSYQQFPAQGVGICIGPQTIEQWKPYIKRSKTILYTGLMGSLKKKKTLSGMQSLLHVIAASPGLSIIAGGDSVAAAQLFHYDTKINFCSTGGGAALAYIAGKELPGLNACI